MTDSDKTLCYAAMTPAGKLQPWQINRRPVGPKDVQIDVKWAGICHSDIHQVKEEWGKAIFPMVPGHEIAGVVSAVGSEVTKFKVGDTAGIGVMVDSCRQCTQCQNKTEQFCSSGLVGAYNSRFKYPHCAEFTAEEGGGPTYGGYSQKIVCDEAYTLLMPSNLDLAAATPLLCAGITTYSPIKNFGLKKEHRFGVIGLGGLGHMALKFAKAWGCHCTVISRGEAKRETALGMGADRYVDSTNEAQFKEAAGSLDFIIDCIGADHDISRYMTLLAVRGKMILVAIPPAGIQLKSFDIIGGSKTLAGSLIGGIEETQEMLDFCSQHNIVCDVEKVAGDYINTAYERCTAGDVKYRFVIDTSTF